MTNKDHKTQLGRAIHTLFDKSIETSGEIDDLHCISEKTMTEFNVDELKYFAVQVEAITHDLESIRQRIVHIINEI